MKRAIITGGSGLIGQGICTRLLAEGWGVASFDLRPGGHARHIHCDVTSEDSVEEAFDALGWDGLDLLVNNAGIAGPTNGPVETLSLTDWRRMIDTHLTGAFLMTRAATPLLRDGGSIINMASTRAFMSEPDTEAYAAAKGGLVALTHALAISLGPRLRANAIAPGWITTESLRAQDHTQHPAGRAGTPDDIAEAVLYLARAGFLTGQTLVIDGGMTRKMIYEA